LFAEVQARKSALRPRIGSGGPIGTSSYREDCHFFNRSSEALIMFGLKAAMLKAKTSEILDRENRRSMLLWLIDTGVGVGSEACNT
jgi:hypothetical protein